MSNTSISGSSSSKAFTLPPPRVHVKALNGVEKHSISLGTTNGGPGVVFCKKAVTVSVYGLPEAVMSNLGDYQPQLELLRYLSKNTLDSVQRPDNTRSGFRHPSSVDVTNNPGGSHTHGGMQYASTTPFRKTEWLVNNPGEVFTVTGSLFAFMILGSISYRESTSGGAMLSTDGIFPNTSGGRGFGRKFPYARRYTPARFQFRWSILDLTDERRQRIYGPTSDTVTVSNKFFPFIPGVPILSGPYAGSTTATIHPKHTPDLASIWLGSSRLSS